MIPEIINNISSSYEIIFSGKYVSKASFIDDKMIIAKIIISKCLYVTIL